VVTKRQKVEECEKWEAKCSEAQWSEVKWRYLVKRVYCHWYIVM